MPGVQFESSGWEAIMFGKITNTFGVMRASWNVLKKKQTTAAVSTVVGYLLAAGGRFLCPPGGADQELAPTNGRRHSDPASSILRSDFPVLPL